MCFPLHINEPYLVGWQYSAFIFLGLNIVSMVVIFSAYTGLFINIRETRMCTSLSSDEMTFALRFFFIVVTNCLCWLPIMCVKVAALANIDVHQGVYAWLVVLVLPINSAVNPGLYTFSTSQFQSQVTNAITLFRRARQRNSSATHSVFHHRCCSDTQRLPPPVLQRHTASSTTGAAATHSVFHHRCCSDTQRLPPPVLQRHTAPPPVLQRHTASSTTGAAATHSVLSPDIWKIQ
nr:relaxin receptor 1-like [Procambarus clarkii]